MSATQKQISRQKRQWKAAVAEGKEFKPKGAWLFDPEKETQALKKAKVVHDHDSGHQEGKQTEKGKAAEQAEKTTRNQKDGKEAHQHDERGHHGGEKDKKETTEKKDEETGKQQGGEEETQQNAKGHYSWERQGWRPLCRDFKRGRCSYGARCRFYHSGADASAGSSTDNGGGSRPACFHYKAGSCLYGEKCWYKHEVGDAGPAAKDSGAVYEDSDIPKPGDLIQQTPDEAALTASIAQWAVETEWELRTTRSNKEVWFSIDSHESLWNEPSANEKAKLVEKRRDMQKTVRIRAAGLATKAAALLAKWGVPMDELDKV
ncbi:unnamed protein product [Prorocentrum cordatum]|uniref:Uncharacterized protein n=1 Tax=Prorocentrum cordatum TaxID=2364126 RepID=A0ABN9S2I1_9DINO|nr:unnamed protein product [Polarella glacialis]